MPELLRGVELLNLTPLGRRCNNEPAVHRHESPVRCGLLAFELRGFLNHRPFRCVGIALLPPRRRFDICLRGRPESPAGQVFAIEKHFEAGLRFEGIPFRLEEALRGKYGTQCRRPFGVTLLVRMQEIRELFRFGVAVSIRE